MFPVGHVFVLTVLHYTNGERRLISGEDVRTHKRYMAYLLQAKSSSRNYDSWICGGAIVSRWLVLTSAACVEDVQNMYAIAGTERYVKSEQLESDPCTSSWMRKVVYTCVPAQYDFQYNKIEKWAHVDVAVVKVGKPFVMNDRAWSQCSYGPRVIPINFDPKHEQPGTDAIVLGWGHARKWRLTNVTTDYNQARLQYTSVSILDQQECKNAFTNPDLSKQIDDVMICTFHGGKLDEFGKQIGSRKYLADSDVARKDNVYKKQDIKGPAKTAVNGTKLSYTEHFGNNWDNYQRNMNETANNFIRRNGICQNDHGGPLVTWINGTEYVIGIASVFRVDPHSTCIGPFLYTSTAKNKKFIQCILRDLVQTDKSFKSLSVCDQPSNGKGFVILRRYIMWTDEHTDSRTHNRSIHLRPQIPMSQYYRRK